MKQLVLDIAMAPAPTFDNFVAGSNAELVAALRALARGEPGERFLYLWGAEGSGRTHLLQALINEFAKARGAALLIDGTSAAGHDFEADAQLVAVDDVDRLAGAAQVGLFNLHNRMRAGSGALVASGDAAPAQLNLRADVATRLATGLVYQVRGLTDEEKAAALDRHAFARGFRLSPEVSEYLLRHVRRDLPSLLAVVDALDRYSLETKRAVTVPLLREILQLSLDLGR
jgi:DnaA family protein